MSFGLWSIVGIVGGGVLTAVCLSFAALPLFGILQQEGYRGSAFLRFVYKKGNMQKKRLSLLALSLFLLSSLFCLCFSFLEEPFPAAVSAVPYFGLYGLYLFSEKKYALKVPLKFTARAVRLVVAFSILTFAVSTGSGFGLSAIAMAADTRIVTLLRFVPFAALSLLLPLLVSVSNGIMQAYEVPHSKGFLRRAKRTLEESNCIKVGITGSFGKTSVKNFACHLLEGKFRVKATPSSYNTPLGIAKFVNEEGADCDVFLAEMGARRRGDIQTLCEMVRPTVGVVTGVCSQHLETFGSLDSIKEEKGVLANFTEKCVLGASAAYAEKEGSLVENREFAAENIELSPTGTDFILRLKERRSPVHTSVLGRHAAEDLALAAALASLLGMTDEEIAERIESIEPVPHRLQHSEENGFHILDDAYNSNPEGAKNAVEVLKLFEGGKCVVTPGLVELGEIEEETNEELGSLFVGLDLVILVGETRVLAVRKGYLSAGGESENLITVPTLQAARSVLAERLHIGDAVLFLNDLPDKY